MSSNLGGIEINGRETIGRALQNNDLEVPINQRWYRWEEQHVTDLFEDFAASIDQDESEYFLGSIVVIKNESGRPQVVDGQQRLATTMILLAAIRDYLYRNNEKDRADDIERSFLLKKDRRTQEKNPKFILSKTDRDYFEKRILWSQDEPERIKLEKLKSSEIKKASHKNLDVAFSLAAKRVNRIAAGGSDDINRLLDWVDFIEYKARVIWVIVPTDSNAFRIFETLNDRGIELSKADLVKNYLFGRAGNRIREVEERWSNMIGSLETVADEEITLTYIRQMLSSKLGPIREKEVYATIKETVRSKQSAIDFGNELASDAVYYAALLNGNQPLWSKYSDKTKESLKTLLELRMEQVRPLLLSIVRVLQPSEVEKCFRLVVNCSVRLLIVGGLGGGTIEKHYSDRARDIRQGEIKTAKELLKGLMTVIPGDSVFKSSFATARVSQAYLARYYLRTLESQVRGDQKFVPAADKEAVNLEHVMPQKLPTGSKIDPDTHQDFHKRLGNLTLIEVEIHKELGNRDFAEKKPYYLRSDYQLTASIGELPDNQWGPTQINDRQAQLAELAPKTWPLHI